jgi:hypothetical protein
MNPIEVLIIEEGITQPHKHVVDEAVLIEEVIAYHRGRGVLLEEFVLFEGGVEIDLKHRVGGHGEHRTFHTRKHHHEVVVSINGVEYKTHAGDNSVKHLRKIGNVPADEVLSEFTGGKFDDLSDDAHVKIKGGEIFTSHVKTGSSS